MQCSEGGASHYKSEVVNCVVQSASQMAHLERPNSGTSGQPSPKTASDIANKKREELLQLPPSVLRELQRQFLETVSVELPVPGKPSNKEGKGQGRNVYSDFIVAPRWREIQGETRWEGLLDPIDPVVRAEILRYGEFAQVAYDCFNNDRHSKYCGSCMYKQEELFEQVGLKNPGYKVTHYIYATAQLDLIPGFMLKSFKDDPWSKDSNWIGYVAVTNSPEEIARLGRRDILVAWRGTARPSEWFENVQTNSASTPFGKKDNLSVSRGFLNVYTSRNANSRYNKKSAQEQVLSAVTELLEEYKHEQVSITITGHSLGSALATLCAYNLSASGMNTVSDAPNAPDFRSAYGATVARRRIPITVFSFAGPRVGNRELQKRLEERGVAVIRVVNKGDLVTRVPNVLLRFGQLEKLKLKSMGDLRYHHVGVKLKLDHDKSPYLETKTFLSILQNQINFHNLEAYLHLVDGFVHSSAPFRETLLRPFALVNKRCNFLKKKYHIPPNWWQVAYKGLKRNEDGVWGLPTPPPELYPKSPFPTCSPGEGCSDGKHTVGDAQPGEDESRQSPDDGMSRGTDESQGMRGTGAEAPLRNGSGVQVHNERTQHWVGDTNGGPWVGGASGAPWVEGASGAPWVEGTGANGTPWVGGASREPWVVTGGYYVDTAIAGPQVGSATRGQYVDTAIARHHQVGSVTGGQYIDTAVARHQVGSATGGQYIDTAVTRHQVGSVTGGQYIDTAVARHQVGSTTGGQYIDTAVAMHHQVGRAAGGHYYVDTAATRHQVGVPNNGQWAGNAFKGNWIHASGGQGVGGT